MIREHLIYAITDSATNMVRALRDTAERLELAVKQNDLAAIAEIQMPSTLWTLDAIRGAACALLRMVGK